MIIYKRALIDFNINDVNGKQTFSGINIVSSLFRIFQGKTTKEKNLCEKTKTKTKDKRERERKKYNCN